MSAGGVSGGGAGVGGGVPEPWDPIRDGSYWLQEIWRRGEPDLRPDCGRFVVPRTAGMAQLEQEYSGRALFFNILGGVPLSPVRVEDLLSALERDCGVRRRTVSVEVTSPPFHFFVRFESEEECSRVLLLAPAVRCCGAMVHARRWHRASRGVAGKLEYNSIVSFDGLPEQMQEVGTLKLLVGGLDGDLVEILPAKDKWIVPVTAWLRQPCSVPKQVTLTVPAPVVENSQPDSDEEGLSPPPARSLISKPTQEYNVIVHVKQVVDRGPLMTDSDAFLPDEGTDLSRRHKFKTWRGKIDGTGPGPHGEA